MVRLHPITASVENSKAETLVLFAHADDKKLICDIKSENLNDISKLLQEAFTKEQFKGEAKETLFFRSVKLANHEHVLIVGCGKKDDLNPESVRVACAIAAKVLKREKAKSATLAAQTLRRASRQAEPTGQAVAEGLLLGSYTYTAMKSAKNDKPIDVTIALRDRDPRARFNKGLEVGKILAECTAFARDLGNSPANHLTPTILAERAKAASKGTRVKFQAFNRQQIKAMKMGGLMGVSLGSTEEPRFIIMEYYGSKPSEKPIVLIGKGITFDSGGISIKPSAGMEEMKFDMCGSAAVIAAIIAVARLKLKVNVVTLVSSTENMPGGAATKPGDVLTAYNGKTIEVNNTDAEGRLVLADALSYACKHYKPAAILDAATLTGACVVALGNVYSGLCSRNDKLVQEIQQAADETGERVWRLPLADEYVDDMKGTYADLSNMSSSKGAGASTAAAFLEQFVEAGVPWAHFDIAGSAWHTGNRYPYNPDKGASGAAVRLFAHFAKNRA